MSFQDWLNINLGKVHLTPDPTHGIDGQCVNLASSWSLAQGGPELSGATAWSIWQNFRHPFYDVIQTSSPKREDIVFFQANNAQIGTGPAGHVDVWVGDKGIDTNWGNDPKAKYVNHPSTGIVGVFRKKVQMSTVDLELGRMIYYTVWGQNGQHGTPNALDGSLDADINAHQVGKETNAFVKEFFYAPQGDAYRIQAAKDAEAAENSQYVPVTDQLFKKK